MADDPVKVAPKIYKVLLENSRVRVLEARLRPGDKASMHSHPATVVYFVRDSKAKFTFPDGKSEIIDGKASQALWLEAQTHSVEAVGKAEAHALIVELK